MTDAACGFRSCSRCLFSDIAEQSSCNACLSLQDLIIVIYSVDFLPQPTLANQAATAIGAEATWTQSQHWQQMASSCLHQLRCSISRIATAAGSGAGPDIIACLRPVVPTDATLHGRDKTLPNAWGLASVGMRVARVSRTQVLDAAQC